MNAYYKLYVQSVFRLANSIVIKSAITASRINDRLIALKKPVNRDDPYSWRYYQNLAGIYHPTNVMMQVLSHDTQEMIDFTVDNLKIHRATKRAFALGSRNFKELIKQYPDQRILIIGILNPIDQKTAIESPDHNILSYDKTLVEQNEQYLIPAIQKFVDLLFVRWNNSDYMLFEPYYYTLLLQGLATKLVPEILNQRKAATRTDYAHSYHIQQFLLSYSPIGREFDMMTQKQKLYFYRNIRYLNLNLGRQEISDEITQKVLTDRGFSLAKYDIEHNTEFMPLELDPTIRLNRTTINGIDPAQGSNSKTVYELLELELPLARDNRLTIDESNEVVTRKMEYSKFNNLPTKVLESNVLDLTDAEPFTLTEVLLNHWIYLSHYGKYTSVVSFTNPSNGDLYRMSVKDAFIFYLLAMNRSVGQDLKYLPVISANRVRRIPAATWGELRSLTDKKKVPDYYIDKIIDEQIEIGTYISTEAFREVSVEIHKIMLAHREMRFYNQDYQAEGQLHTIIDRCYMDIRIDLGRGKQVTYDAWLEEQGIATDSMGKLEYGLIAAELFKVCTGGDLGNQTTTRQVHAAMMRIMRELSPYSVQFISTINDSPIKVVDGKFPTLTIPHTDTETTIPVELVIPVITEMRAYEHRRVDVPACPPQVKIKFTETRDSWKVPVYVGIDMKSITTKSMPIEIVLPGPKMLDPTVVDLSTLTQNGVAGYSAIPAKPIADWITDGELSGYEALTDSRRRSFLRL